MSTLRRILSGSPFGVFQTARAGAVLFCLGIVPLPAATLYWDANGTTAGFGTDATGNWRTSGAGLYWGSSDGTATPGLWVTGSDAVFSASDDTDDAYTVTANSISANSVLIEHGNITFTSGTLTLTGSASIDVASGLTATFSTGVSGTAGLVKDGEGTLVLTGSKNFSGTADINEGTLRLGSANVFSSALVVNVEAGATLDANGYSDSFGTISGAGNLNLGAGTLTLASASGSTEFSGVISGTGGLVKTGAHTLTLSGASDYTGSTTVSGGTLIVAHSQGLGTGAGVTATTVSSSRTLHLVGGAGEDGLTIERETLSIAGTGISSGGALRNVSGDNTWTGAVTLSNGATFVSAAGSLTLSGGVTAADEDLTLNGAGSFSLGAVTTGTGDLFVNATGTTTLTGANTYTGNTEVGAGATLRLDAGTLADTTDLVIATGATFDLNGQTDTIASIAGAGNITLAAGSLTSNSSATTTFSGVMSGTGSFTKTGSGTLSLSGANSYTGDTTVNGGSLRLLASNVLSDSTDVSVATGATFNLNNYTDTVATIAGDGTVALGTGSLTLAGSDDTTFTGAITGSGTLTKSGGGVLTLADDLTFTGTFNLAGGTLRLSDADLTVTNFNVTGTSFLDFAGAASSLTITNFTISDGVTLTIQNWAGAADFFYTLNWAGAAQDSNGAAPMNRIIFEGFTNNDTAWRSFDERIVPVPEPSTYGALLLAAAGGLLAWRRRIKRRAV